MEKREIKTEDKKGMLTLENRKKLSLSGVIEVVSLTDEQIMLNTNLGSLTIKGEGLKMNKLDVQSGDMLITGLINSCIYVSKEFKKDKESIFSKLFK